MAYDSGYNGIDDRDDELSPEVLDILSELDIDDGIDDASPSETETSTDTAPRSAADAETADNASTNADTETVDEDPTSDEADIAEELDVDISDIPTDDTTVAEETEDETDEDAALSDEDTDAEDEELSELNAEEDAAYAESLAEDEEAVSELEHQLSEMEGAEEARFKVHYPEYFDENMPDTQERADRICVSIDVDDFGRDIVEPVFENVLRQSKNTVKLHYSRIKNEIQRYRDVVQEFTPEYETFYYKRRPLIRLEFKGGKLTMLIALKADELPEKCPHTDNTGDSARDLPVRILINAKYIDLALEAVTTLVKKRKIPKLKSYAPIAYAERYTFNQDSVLRGKEKRPPVDGEYDGPEYTPIMGELVKGVVARTLQETDTLAKEQLMQIRESAAALKDAVSALEPIAYFYDVAVRTEDNTVAYVNCQQVLNDKFLGRLLPQQFFAVAETSNRIEKLNLMHLEAVVNECNANPEILFVLQISVRFLVDSALISTLIEKSVTENHNLIMAFDGIMLEKTGEIGQNSLKKLMDNGVYIMLDNVESVNVRCLTELPYDYIRFDSRVYSRENVKATNHLDILLQFCKQSGITCVARYVDVGKVKRYFLDHPVDIMQGDAICAPSRLTSVALVSYHKV